MHFIAAIDPPQARLAGRQRHQRGIGKVHATEFADFQKAALPAFVGQQNARMQGIKTVRLSVGGHVQQR
ncbi:hypothetical protein D3C76_1567670 [compost metagenome]